MWHMMGGGLIDRRCQARKAMRFDIKLGSGPRIANFHLNLRPGPSRGRDGRIEFLLGTDSQEARFADWAEIAPGVYSIIVGGRSYEARVTPDLNPASSDEARYAVTVGTRAYQVELRDPRSRPRAAAAAASHEGPQEIVAPMPGRIVKVLVKPHQEVDAGQGLLVIEAMKMQNEFKAPRAGRVEEIYVEEGAGVEAGSKLARLE